MDSMTWDCELPPGRVAETPLWGKLRSLRVAVLVSTKAIYCLWPPPLGACFRSTLFPANGTAAATRNEGPADICRRKTVIG